MIFENRITQGLSQEMKKIENGYEIDKLFLYIILNLYCSIFFI